MNWPICLKKWCFLSCFLCSVPRVTCEEFRNRNTRDKWGHLMVTGGQKMTPRAADSENTLQISDCCSCMNIVARRTRPHHPIFTLTMGGDQCGGRRDDPLRSGVWRQQEDHLPLTPRTRFPTATTLKQQGVHAAGLGCPLQKGCWQAGPCGHLGTWISGRFWPLPDKGDPPGLS